MTSDAGVPPVDVCVCTFKRPHLARTLASLAALILRPGRKIRVIVADNEEEPAAQPLAVSTAKDNGLALHYIHAPARNISVARNACLNATEAPFYAFIDDDELATPAWLEAMMSVMEDTGADVVLGPVKAVYDSDQPEWMKQGDFHSTKPVFVDGEICTGYSCNVLMRKDAAALQGLRFREELGRSGGEDTVFFSSVYRAGGKIAYAPEALVTEAVAHSRARFSWLLQRYFRSGQTHGLQLIETSGANKLTYLQNIVIASAKALFCYVAAVVALAVTIRAKYWILRGTLHAGVVLRLLGKRELVQYG